VSSLGSEKGTASGLPADNTIKVFGPLAEEDHPHALIALSRLMSFAARDLQSRRSGGDMSQDLFRKGWTETNFMHMEWVITIKRQLVPDSTVFLFAEPRFMGKFFTLEDTS
jgi:hypothetical protein